MHAHVCVRSRRGCHCPGHQPGDAPRPEGPGAAAPAPRPGREGGGAGRLVDRQAHTCECVSACTRACTPPCVCASAHVVYMAWGSRQAHHFGTHTHTHSRTDTNRHKFSHTRVLTHTDTRACARTHSRTDTQTHAGAHTHSLPAECTCSAHLIRCLSRRGACSWP